MLTTRNKWHKYKQVFTFSFIKWGGRDAFLVLCGPYSHSKKKQFKVLQLLWKLLFLELWTQLCRSPYPRSRKPLLTLNTTDLKMYCGNRAHSLKEVVRALHPTFIYTFLGKISALLVWTVLVGLPTNMVCLQ